MSGPFLLLLEPRRCVSTREISQDNLRKALYQITLQGLFHGVKKGFERAGGAEKLHFYNIARASCGEVRPLLYVVEDNHTHASEQAVQLRDHAIQTGKLLSGLIASTQRRNIGKTTGIILVLTIPATYLLTHWGF